MAEYCLTAEEILYLAAVGGTDKFYGVEDTLSGLSDRELRLKVMELESSLEEKGYMEEDFDGNKSMLRGLEEMIDRCGNCERFLRFEKMEIGSPLKSYMYFMTGNTAYKMVCGEEQYTLSPTGFPEIRREAEESPALKEAEKREEGSFRIPYGKLEKAVTLTRRGSADKGEELLKEEGVSDFAAQTVINGVLNRADFYAWLFMDLRDERNPGYSVHCLAKGGLIIIEYETDDEENQGYIGLLTADDAGLKEKLKAGFEKLGCVGEEEAFS